MPYANNKGADHPAQFDQRLVVHCLDSIIHLVAIAEPSFCGCAGRFVSYLVANPEDRFSHDEAHINLGNYHVNTFLNWTKMPN